MAVFAVLLLYSMLIFSCASRHCSQTLRPSPWFLLIRTCSISVSPPLNAKNLLTLEECEEFAVKSRALAFNFVSPEKLEDSSKRSCIVYECQELDPLLLEDDGFYDYYGIYRDIDPDSNLTCVPGLGMYHLHRDAANYSEALEACEGEGAQLARVTSPQQTNQLSALVATLGRSLQQAYVGLSDTLQEGHFVTVEDEPLNCFDYRAWAPGHPRSRRRSEDCVVLDSRRGWRTVDCGRRLPFLCELVEPVPRTCQKPKRMTCRDEAEARRRQRQEFQECHS